MAVTELDMKAIELLLKELSKVKSIPKPPTDYAQAGEYKRSTEKVISDSTSTITDVRQYATRINGTIDQVRAALKDQTTNIQNSIHKALSSITDQPSIEGYSRPSQVLQYVKELQQAAKSALRLQEFMLETEKVFAKIQENVDVTMEDIDTLKGYLESWKLEKDENYEEEKRRLEEEQRNRAEEERRRREEKERRRKEEEERRRKEEEERKKREEEERERKRREEEEKRLEEERKRKEEEDRLKREEEERLRREKEEKRKREEEERRKLEEEERRRKEEEERKKREEEERERKRREEEEKRLEEERKRKEEEDRLKREEEERLRREKEERRKREEEERRKLEEEEARVRELERQRLEAEMSEKERQEAARKWRLDPTNWKDVLFNRDNDVVDCDRSYHKNVCCVVSTPPPEDGSDEDTTDLECLASDEVDDIIETLSDGEKLASSVVSINSKNGEVALEAPVRAFLPYCQISDPGDELIIKVSINGSDWVTSTPLLPTKQIETKYNTKLLGTEIDQFECVRLVVVARRKTQTIIVDKPGISQCSNYDKNIKIFVPRDTVSCPTELKMSVKPVTDETLINLSKDSSMFDGVMSVSSLLTLTCQRPFAKDIELDLVKAGKRSSKFRIYHLYRTSDHGWKFADTAYKARNDDVTVILPTMKSEYSLIQLDMSPNVPKENCLKIAESIFDYTNKTIVRVILRQHTQNPAKAMLHCVKRELETSRLTELKDSGYTLGTDISKEFHLSEGQMISVSCSGNIDNEDQDIVFPYFVYMDTAQKELTFHVKDKYKQKDLPNYIGNLVCMIHDPNHSGGGNSSSRIEIPISLPKLERIRTRPRTAPIRVPYYLSSLAYFLACKLTEKSEGLWFNVIERLEDKGSIQALYRRARGKVADTTDEVALCRAVLLDWMKTKERQMDKLGPIEKALDYNGLSDLRHECHSFVEHLKETLSDSALTKVAKQLSADPRQIGSALRLEERLITKILQDYSGETHDQIEALLQEWRHSEDAVHSGAGADQYLKDLLNL